MGIFANQKTYDTFQISFFMSKVKALLKEQVNELSKKELVDIVLKLAGKRFNYEFLLVNFLDKEGGELALFEEAIIDIDRLSQKEFKGRTIQHQMVKRLNACTKRITEFTIETKSKKMETDLVLYVLELQFENQVKIFGARFSGYDYKVGLLLKRFITLITKRLHPDYLADYLDKANEFLNKLHHTSNRINTIKDLPQMIEY